MTIIDLLRSGIETQNWGKICQAYEQMSGQKIHIAGENVVEKKRRGRPPKSQILFPEHDTKTPSKNKKKRNKIQEPQHDASGDGEMQFITEPINKDDFWVKNNQKIKKLIQPSDLRTAPTFICSKCKEEHYMNMKYKTSVSEGRSTHICDNCK